MENKTLSKHRLTEVELSAYWGVSRRTLQKWRSLRIGPAYIKIGSKAVYPIEAVIAYEQARTIMGTGDYKALVEAKDEK